MNNVVDVMGIAAEEVRPCIPTPVELRKDLLRHLLYGAGTDPAHATPRDWRIALSFTVRDRAMEVWYRSTRRTETERGKRVYYLSMEYLIGRLLGDLTLNLGLQDTIEEVCADLGVDLGAVLDDEPDAALGNGGLGRLAACYMESMATVACPAIGYGMLYENGLFRQTFDNGRQVEHPDEWLGAINPWNMPRAQARHEIGFGGYVDEQDGRAVWHPNASVYADAYDTPVVGWQGTWANTLRLWKAEPTSGLDLERFNAGDYKAATEPELMARTISRVLYPEDTTWEGKRLRLAQEYFLSAAAVRDIVTRFLDEHADIRRLPDHVAIQLNDTHPTMAGPELVRLLVDEHGIDFDEAVDIAAASLSYTNHTLMPEALEEWSVDLLGSLLPRHLTIVNEIDALHARRFPGRTDAAKVVDHGMARMGNLAFIMSHRVNGVSALHSELVRDTLFPELNALHGGRIVNETNGITPRRWLRLANPALSSLVTDTVGEGWESDLDRLRGLEEHLDEESFLERFGQAKRDSKARLAGWLHDRHGITVNPDALFDVQVKRFHEYKRQLLNILETIARWQAIKADPGAGWVPRVKIFGGKAAPGYAFAKQVIRFINDVALVINHDPVTKDLLQVVFPANYNVSMAEVLIPAADVSEQISTAGMEASGTSNMKFALNGALTIGTLDGANVEIRELVGPEHFFLFGLTTDEVAARRARPGQARAAIEASDALPGVLASIADGVFSPGEPGRYNDILSNLWDHDWYLNAADFDSYHAAQGTLDEAYRDRRAWRRSAVLNTARVGFFSSDRAIRGYMDDIWAIDPAM